MEEEVYSEQAGHHGEEWARLVRRALRGRVRDGGEQAAMGKCAQSKPEERAAAGRLALRVM